jgi:hypothetical protein
VVHPSKEATSGVLGEGIPLLAMLNGDIGVSNHCGWNQDC